MSFLTFVLGALPREFRGCGFFQLLRSTSPANQFRIFLCGFESCAYVIKTRTFHKNHEGCGTR